MPVKRSPPQGEFAWIMDGKTEYYGQLVDPLSAVEREGIEDDSEVDLEIRWTHNGRYEWVTLDRVRVETEVIPVRRAASGTSTPIRKPRQRHAKSTPKTISPKSASTRKAPRASKKRLADETEPETPCKAEEEKDAVKSTPEITPENNAEEPPAKKQKVDGATSLFVSISSQVVEAKNAIVSGFKGVYEELLGRASSK